MSQKNKLIIFDCDGVLINSEWAHREARYRLLVKESAPYSEDPYIDQPGFSCWSFWYRLLKDPLLADHYTAKQYDLALRILTHSNLFPDQDLLCLLAWLQNSNAHLCVASGSPSDFVHGVLQHYNLQAYFQAVFTANDVEHVKPAPDLFIASLNHFNIPAQEVVVIEDSDSGCQAAQSANCHCIAFSRYNDSQQRYQKADIVLPSMETIQDYLQTRHSIVSPT